MTIAETILLSLRPTQLSIFQPGFVVGILCVGISSFAQKADAQFVSWLNTDGESPGNWSSVSVPGTDANVIFGFVGDYDVDFLVDHTVADLIVTNEAAPTVGIDGFHTTDQTLSMTGHATIDPDAHLAIQNGIGATFHVDANNAVEVQGQLSVMDGARLNSGYFDIGAGAIISSVCILPLMTRCRFFRRGYFIAC
jgi:hypothetical protein